MSEAPRRRGRFVTFEGIEGTGKTTQLARLTRRLERAGLEPLVTREPGGTELGRGLRALLLRADGPPIGPTAEMLLYTTDRAQHLEQLVLPALEAGRLVLCDRYLDATLAYQGYGRRLGVEPILALHRSAPLDLRPDRTVLLDLEPAVALARSRQRNRDERLDASEGRFEQERLEFHRAVRQGYLELARQEPDRLRVIDAGGPVDVVERRVLGAMRDVLPARVLE